MNGKQESEDSRRKETRTHFHSQFSCFQQASLAQARACTCTRRHVHAQLFQLQLSPLKYTRQKHTFLWKKEKTCHGQALILTFICFHASPKPIKPERLRSSANCLHVWRCATFCLIFIHRKSRTQRKGKKKRKSFFSLFLFGGGGVH